MALADRAGATVINVASAGAPHYLAFCAGIIVGWPAYTIMQRLFVKVKAVQEVSAAKANSWEWAQANAPRVGNFTDFFRKSCFVALGAGWFTAEAKKKGQKVTARSILAKANAYAAQAVAAIGFGGMLPSGSTEEQLEKEVTKQLSLDGQLPWRHFCGRIPVSKASFAKRNHPWYEGLASDYSNFSKTELISVMNADFDRALAKQAVPWNFFFMTQDGVNLEWRKPPSPFRVTGLPDSVRSALSEVMVAVHEHAKEVVLKMSPIQQAAVGRLLKQGPSLQSPSHFRMPRGIHDIPLAMVQAYRA